MGLNSIKEKRTECDGGLIFFDERKFGIDTKVFKRIEDEEILDFRCNRCEHVKECTKHDIFVAIMK